MIHRRKLPKQPRHVNRDHMVIQHHHRLRNPPLRLDVIPPRPHDQLLHRPHRRHVVRTRSDHHDQIIPLLVHRIEPQGTQTHHLRRRQRHRTTIRHELLHRRKNDLDPIPHVLVLVVPPVVQPLQPRRDRQDGEFDEFHEELRVAGEFGVAHVDEHPVLPGEDGGEDGRSGRVGGVGDGFGRDAEDFHVVVDGLLFVERTLGGWR
mmetsp:Transcript_28539/g.61339  ORF Transcript_28539/g.61339 Transcript_28539/m.61339 type:complete len:205 (+) Transcript_28539:559-1173(+)